MIISNGKISEAEISFDVEDHGHKQVFKKTFVGLHNDISDMERLFILAKGLVEVAEQLRRQVKAGVPSQQMVGEFGRQKKIESFGIYDGDLRWCKEEKELQYEWYKIYIQEPTSANNLKETQTFHVVHDGLMTEAEADKCFSRSEGTLTSGRKKTVWGKTGRFYDPNTKTFHSFEKTPSITRKP